MMPFIRIDSQHFMWAGTMIVCVMGNCLWGYVNREWIGPARSLVALELMMSAQ